VFPARWFYSSLFFVALVVGGLASGTLVCVAAQNAPVISTDSIAPLNPGSALDIVRRSVDRDWTDYSQLKNYTYQETLESRQFDKNGKLSRTESQTYEEMVLVGQPYERLIARDGAPLAPKDAQKEQEKLDRELFKRQHESAGELAKLERQRTEERRFIREIPEAFNFRLLGTETVSGQPSWIILAEPKPGYRPRESQARVFTKVRAKIWVEQATFHWVKLDAEALDALSFGFGLLRVARGASMHFEQTRVNDEIWLPSAALIRADARLALVKKLRAEFDVRYSNYHKFQTDSHIEVETDQSPAKK
jgi:hypothetical protein